MRDAHVPGAFALTENERDRAVAAIIDAALPELPTARDRMRALWRDVPLSALVFGIGDCVFVAFAVLLACLIPAAFALSGGYAPGASIILFMVSPVFFATLQGLSAWKDIESGTAAWRATCRVAFHELTAMRMLAFGCASVAVCVPATALIWLVSSSSASFGWMLAVACASLAVYSAVSLWLYRMVAELPARIQGVVKADTVRAEAATRVLPFVGPLVLWVALGTWLLNDEGARLLVMQVPTVVFAVVALFATAVFIQQVAKTFRTPCMLVA